MTISTTTSRVSYNGNGVTTVFSAPFRFFASTDLVVELVTVSTGASTTLTLTTHYTVTGADDESGGSLTMLTAPAVGQRLVIRRVITATQEVDYVAGDPFPAETHERALDRLTMLAQQGEEVNARALVFPSGDTASGELPAVATRASKLLGFNSSGELTVSAPASGSAAELALDLASTASGNGAEMVAFKPSGTGAIDSTVAIELGATVRVDQYASVQAAIDYVASMGGGVVEAGPGDYLISGDGIINIKAGVTLRGKGAATRFISGTGGRNGNHVFVYLKDGSAIEDCRMSGSDYVRQSGGADGICYNKIGITTQGAVSGENFRVSRVGFEKFTNSHVFVFDGHRGALIEGCYTFGQQPGVYVDVDANYSVTDWNATQDAGKITAGTQVYCLTNFYNSGSGVKDVTVTKGRHLNINDAFVGVNGNSSHHIITDNVFRKNTAGYYGGWGIDLNTADQCTATGNHIEGGSAGAHLYGSTGCTLTGNTLVADRGAWLDDPTTSKNTVTGNTIRLTQNVAGVATKIGVSISGAVNNTVTGNTIDGQSIASAKGVHITTNGSGSVGNSINVNTICNTDTGIESADSSNDANWSFGNVFRSVTTAFPRAINNNLMTNVKGISGTASNANNLGGTVTVTGAATSQAVVFANAEPDASYRVMLTPRSASGTPAAGAFTPVAPSSLTTAGFTVNVQAAPGAGNSVSFNWMLFRA